MVHIHDSVHVAGEKTGQTEREGHFKDENTIHCRNSDISSLICGLQ